MSEVSYSDDIPCRRSCKNAGNCKTSCAFSSDVIKEMTLKDFEKNFGFKPIDKAEKLYFSMNKKRILSQSAHERILNTWTLDRVVF